MVLISKNQCLYDFIYIAPRPNFVEGVGTLLEVAQSLSTNRFKTEGLIEGSEEKSTLEITPPNPSPPAQLKEEELPPQ